MKNLIVITGASAGIGKSTAQLLSKAGYPLLLLGRRLEEMEALHLPNTLCKSVDVRDAEAFQSAVAEAEKQYGSVDCIINNAGVMLLGELSTQDPSEWNTMIDVNIKGVLNGMHCVLNAMVQRNFGTIINVSSIAGKKTFPSHAVYCGTKFAVHAITEATRAEVSASNVRVILIAPGIVETELLSHTTDKNIVGSYEEWKKSIDGGLAPEDIAQAIYYAYKQPQNVCVREIVLAPTKQHD